MKIRPTCPCCSNTMLHHVDNKREYWFCRYCWQEMPDLQRVNNYQVSRLHQLIGLSANLERVTEAVPA